MLGTVGDCLDPSTAGDRSGYPGTVGDCQDASTVGLSGCKRRQYIIHSETQSPPTHDILGAAAGYPGN